MLSVILYGRNDNHGYNLHKRGAISLNAIAELLRGVDDELIFVDYNTPDDLPTFPEAIADTLTEQAKAKLRILRVRPAQHARFAAQTHLNALEPIARNVAVRRCNPANRWVLSTNTDMIFVPRSEGASLGDIVGGLEDGFYHLPRFELPEALWESLHRSDAQGVIRSAGLWGERFHLDEVVRSGGDNLFDGPGDFQLFLRADLFAIGGFDEAMLKGWHVDANVARRMKLLRGKVTSAEAHLRGYHCDHTRQASPYHKGDRVENDPARFVDRVERPEIAGQLDSFGLAGETVEEVRLGRGTSARYLAALDAALPEGRAGALESAYVPEAFGQMTYPLEHVLPYLFDLISCIPEDARIGYVGARADTYAALVRGWRAMGGVRAPILPQEAGWLSGETAPLERWAEDADVFLFEVGAEKAATQADLSAEERERLWLVNRAMALAFASDARRQREGAPPRRAVVINAIHNSFEAQLFRRLTVTLTPYSSRIRHGFIVDPERAPSAHPSRERAAQALGRARPISDLEAKRAAAAFSQVQTGGKPVSEALAQAGLILALVDAGSPDLPSTQDPQVLAALSRLRAARIPAEQFALPVAADAGLGAANRLVRLEDWSDPAFVDMAYALFPNRRHNDPGEWSAWTWERTALALNLNAALPLADRPRILVAAELPELLAFMLSNLGARVDIADPRRLARGELKATDWRGELIHNTFAVPASAAPLTLVNERAGEIAQGFRYEAVLLPQNALFAGGRDSAAALLQQAAALLREGGHLGMTPLVLVNDVPPVSFGDNLTAGLVRDARWTELAAAAGLVPQDGVDARLSTGALDTLAAAGDADASTPPLLLRDGEAIRAPAAYAFRLAPAHDGAEEAWAALDLAIRRGVLDGGSSPEAAGGTSLPPAEIHRLVQLAADAAFAGATGSVLRRLDPSAEGVTRSPRAARIPAAAEGVVLAGGLGRMAPGDYDLRIEGSLAAGSSPLEVVVICGGAVAAHAPVVFDGGGFMLRFRQPGPLSAPVAVALRSPGGAAAEILDILVD